MLLAKINVEDLDRDSSIYYVTYSTSHDPDPGFFRRLFRSDRSDRIEAATGQRFRVQVEDVGEEVQVSVAMDDQQAPDSTENLILRERLLKLIKEYST